MDVDVVVIGLGPGGEYAADKLARAGLTVIGVEKHLVGGECPFYGCIPSKLWIRGSNLVGEARRADRLAGPTSITPDWGRVRHRIRAEATHEWSDAGHVEGLEDAGVTSCAAMRVWPDRVGSWSSVPTAADRWSTPPHAA